MTDKSYLIEYVTFDRWINYYYQIDFITKHTKNYQNKILEIGIGNGLIRDYLSKIYPHFYTFDNDPHLKPDYVGDIRKTPFAHDAFDLISICQVMEHIPFEDFGKALQELKRIVKKTILISLPIHNKAVSINIISWDRRDMQNKYKSKIFSKLNNIKEFNLNKEGFDEHYWEIGVNNITPKKLEEIFHDMKLPIIEKLHAPLSPSTIYYILEKV